MEPVLAALIQVKNEKTRAKIATLRGGGENTINFVKLFFFFSSSGMICEDD